jgi:hypothetical protein
MGRAEAKRIAICIPGLIALLAVVGAMPAQAQLSKGKTNPRWKAGAGKCGLAAAAVLDGVMENASVMRCRLLHVPGRSGRGTGNEMFQRTGAATRGRG